MAASVSATSMPASCTQTSVSSRPNAMKPTIAANVSRATTVHDRERDYQRCDAGVQQSINAPRSRRNARRAMSCDADAPDNEHEQPDADELERGRCVVDLR